MNFRDVELLSAYLDGQLSPPDVARLEARLTSDPNLKATLDGLRQTRGVLRRLPQRRAPRNFTMTPKLAGIRPPEPRAYPIFRLATALAAFLFVASVALNAITPFAAQRLAAAPAPVYGMGGGGGGPSESAPLAATEAPVQPFAAVAPTPTAEGTLSAEAATQQALQTEDTSRALGAAPSTPANKAAPSLPGTSTSPNQLPVPLPWEIGLGILMLVCAVAAWLLRLSSERRIRDRWNK